MLTINQFVPAKTMRKLAPLVATIAMSIPTIATTNKPDTFEKTNTEIMTNTPNDTTNAKDAVSSGNSLNAIINESSPVIDFYNEMSATEKASLRENTTNEVVEKIQTLKNDLEENGVNTEINTLYKNTECTNYELIQDLIPTTSVELSNENNTTNINMDEIKNIISSTQTKDDEYNTMKSAVYDITKYVYELTRDYGYSVNACFNSYYDTPTGEKAITMPYEVENFMKQATGKTIDEFTKELISANSTKQVKLVQTFGNKLIEQEKTEKQAVKDTAAKRFTDIIYSAANTLITIEEMEKSEKGMTMDLVADFGKNPETETIKIFLTNLKDLYDKTTDIQNLNAENNNVPRKPGRYIEGKPVMKKINGRNAMVQKVVFVKSDGSVENKYYDVYNFGREIK